MFSDANDFSFTKIAVFFIKKCLKSGLLKVLLEAAKEDQRRVIKVLNSSNFLKFGFIVTKCSGLSGSLFSDFCA